MNDWQIEKQVKYTLAARKWEGNTGYNVVFGSEAVFVSVADIDAALSYPRTPMCMVRPGEAVVDPEHDEHQDMIRFGFAVRVIALVMGDALGEAALLGANRAGATTTGQGSSEGRGLQELEVEVRAAIRLMQPQNGIRVQFRGKSGIGAQAGPAGNYVVFRDIVFEAIGTSDPDYETATNFRATGGAGSVALAWTNPPDRYDLYKIVVVRKAGSTPPASVSDGTALSLSADTITALVTRDLLSTSKTDAIAAGTYSYSFFAQYDETHNPGSAPTSAERTSPAATVSGVVVS